MVRCALACLFSAFIVGICSAGPAEAELTAEQTNEAEVLIKQFSAREFAVRQAAVQKLIKMGSGVIGLIKRTSAGTTDAEVKLRCRMVIKGLTAARRLVERRVKDLGPPQPPGSRFGPRRSANGDSVAYTIRRGGKMLVVHNGKEGPEYDLAAAWGHIAFSPDGKRLAYIARRADEGFIVCDGKEGPKYDRVDGPTFSPDGKRLAYIAHRAKKWFVVCDGKEWRDVRPRFSPHDHIWLRGVVQNKLHYIALDDDRLSLIEANWPTAEEQQITEVIKKRFPASVGLRVASPFIWSYRPRRGEADLVTTYATVSWGKDRATRNETGGLQFSPYGQHAAYAVIVTRGKKTAVVFRDRELGMYDQIQMRVCFSPDGNHLAYLAVRGRKRFVVRDGKEGPLCDGAWQITFSPDSKRLAYVVRRGREKSVVCDGDEFGKYDDIKELTFSPDGKHVAYIAKRGHTRFVVCDGREGPHYHQVQEIAFSPDSRHLCYVANGEMMVCDGIEGPPHDKIVLSGNARIYAGKALRYVALDGNRECLIEVDWPRDLDRTHGLQPVEP